ncbi:MAG: hypothetical protein ACTHQM_12895 [Thermoanaerobaculia bacterium]
MNNAMMIGSDQRSTLRRDKEVMFDYCFSCNTHTELRIIAAKVSWKKVRLPKSETFERRFPMAAKKKAAAKKAVAKKGGAKKAAPMKKSAAKKAAPSKKSAKKAAPAKKAAAKKAPAKKAPAKKGGAKRPAARAAAAKRPAAKAPAAKKAGAKKGGAKKSGSKGGKKPSGPGPVRRAAKKARSVISRVVEQVTGNAPEPMAEVIGSTDSGSNN